MQTKHYFNSKTVQLKDKESKKERDIALFQFQNGSIKSQDGGVGAQSRYYFNSKTVQLKEKHKRWQLWQKRISIPKRFN